MNTQVRYKKHMCSMANFFQTGVKSKNSLRKLAITTLGEPFSKIILIGRAHDTKQQSPSESNCRTEHFQINLELKVLTVLPKFYSRKDER